MFSLSQALAAIENKPEFSAKNKGSYTVIDYTISSCDTFVGATQFETFVLHNLRGTAFDNETGLCIRAGYNKFFNYGEFPEFDKQLDFGDKHVITQKMYGSSIFPLYTREGTFFGTRAGVTDIAILAQEFALNSKANYSDFIYHCQTAFYATPIFEFCSRKNRVVLDYPEDMLVLTSIRYINSGVYFDYESMKTLAECYGVPVVKKINSIVQNEFDSFKQTVSELVNDEGVVIRFEDGIMAGHMIKVKALDYVKKHKAVDQLKFTKDLIKLYLCGALDDILPILSEDRRDHVIKFADEFSYQLLTRYYNQILGEYGKFTALETQKDFALAIQDNPYKQFLFGMRANKKLMGMLLSWAEKQCSTQQMCSDMLNRIGVKMVY